MKFVSQEEIASVSERIEAILGRELSDLEHPMVELAVRYYAQILGEN